MFFDSHIVEFQLSRSGSALFVDPGFTSRYKSGSKRQDNIDPDLKQGFQGTFVTGLILFFMRYAGKKANPVVLWIKKSFFYIQNYKISLQVIPSNMYLLSPKLQSNFSRYGTANCS